MRVARLPNSTQALSASDDGTLKLWDVTTGACILTFASDNPFICCARTADGRTVIAGDSLGVVYFLRLSLPLVA